MAEIGNGTGGINADHVLDLLADAFRLGGGQIDLVEHRHDFEIVVDGLIDVGEGLGFDTLAGVDHQQSALAGGQRARDFVGEVHVSGRVDQVQHIGFAVLGLVVEAHGVGLDGDAAFALKIHRIQNLILHIAVGHRTRELDETVGERRLAVVNMSDDGKIADQRNISHLRRCLAVQRSKVKADVRALIPR